MSKPQDISHPTAGYFRHRLRRGAVVAGVHIWHGPPLDPVTGEEMDRSHRWQAHLNGEPVDIDTVWPQCTGEPITEDEYRRMCARQDWARQHALASAYADPGRKRDPLSPQEPLPF